MPLLQRLYYVNADLLPSKWLIFNLFWIINLNYSRRVSLSRRNVLSCYACLTLTHLDFDPICWANDSFTALCLFPLLPTGRILSRRMWTTCSTAPWPRCLSPSTQGSTKCVVGRFWSCSSPMNCRPWSLATPTMTGRNLKGYQTQLTSSFDIKIQTDALDYFFLIISTNSFIVQYSCRGF